MYCVCEERMNRGEEAEGWVGNRTVEYHSTLQTFGCQLHRSRLNQPSIPVNAILSSTQPDVFRYFIPCHAVHYSVIVISVSSKRAIRDDHAVSSKSCFAIRSSHSSSIACSSSKGFAHATTFLCAITLSIVSE